MILFVLLACTGSTKVLSGTSATALFLPPEIEAYVDMYVDVVDGKKVKLGIMDSVRTDAGSHEVEIRLEYQPAAGSAVIVGGLANLMLRSATNKTFTTKMSITVEESHEYRFIVTSGEKRFFIALFDETTNAEQVKYTFELKDGKLTRVF